MRFGLKMKGGHKDLSKTNIYETSENKKVNLATITVLNQNSRRLGERQLYERQLEGLHAWADEVEWRKVGVACHVSIKF